MIRTNRMMPEYDYPPNDSTNRSNYGSRDYPYVIPSNPGYITNRSKHGPYSITERDFGDHRVSYYVPSEYENTYDISHLDEVPMDDDQQRYDSPVLVRRRYYRHYDEDDHDEDELPIIPPRRYAHPPVERPTVIKRIYIRPPPSPTPSPPPQRMEYIYEEDYTPNHEETIEYVPPKQRSPVHRSPPPPPRRVPVTPLRFDDYTPPPRSKQTYPTTTTLRNSYNRSLPPMHNRPKHLSLKEVLAQNRARRGSRIPKPRREVDEVTLHDLPTYNKNYVKNDFIVHK